MTMQLAYDGRDKRVAVFVSKYDHCLYDLLLRHRAGELDCDLPLIVSNHPDLEPVARQFGIDFHVFPIRRENKREQEEAELALLEKEGIGLVVLARYMQILSGAFLDRLGVPVINVHHSLLPAFTGAGPYERAKQRGVKLIGATAHYVTEELDAGPIIEQDVIRVSHRDNVGMLKRLRGTPIVRHDQEFGMLYAPHPPYEVLRTREIGFSVMQRMRRFARYWDLIANSGNFLETTPLIWSPGW